MKTVLLRCPYVAQAREGLRARFAWQDLDNEAPGRWMTLREILRFRFVRLCYWLWDVEWDERWGAWPHCCTQAGCWVHRDSRRCWWCALARLLRREAIA